VQMLTSFVMMSLTFITVLPFSSADSLDYVLTTLLTRPTLRTAEGNHCAFRPRFACTRWSQISDRQMRTIRNALRRNPIAKRRAVYPTSASVISSTAENFHCQRIFPLLKCSRNLAELPDTFVSG
jgi:hypothetical protein